MLSVQFEEQRVIKSTNVIFAQSSKHLLSISSTNVNTQNVGFLSLLVAKN